MTLGPIGTIVKAISDDLVAALSAGGYPPLVDGKILVGPKRVTDASSPPRVVFVPAGNAIGPKNLRQPTGDSPTDRAINQQRSLLSEWISFEVHVWGAAPRTGVPATDDEASQSGDYDATRTLYQQVIRYIAKNLGPIVTSGEKGIVKMSALEWNDPQGASTFGREAVFSFAVSTPVLDDLVPYAPSDVGRSIGVSYDGSDPVTDPPIVVT